MTNVLPQLGGVNKSKNDKIIQQKNSISSNNNSPSKKQPNSNQTDSNTLPNLSVTNGKQSQQQNRKNDSTNNNGNGTSQYKLISTKELKSNSGSGYKNEEHYSLENPFDSNTNNGRKKSAEITGNNSPTKSNSGGGGSGSGGNGNPRRGQLEKLDMSNSPNRNRKSSISTSPLNAKVLDTQASTDAVFTIDANCTILRWNKTCAAMLGWTVEEVTNSNKITLEMIFPIMQKLKPDLKKYFERVEQKPKDPFNTNLQGSKIEDMDEKREEIESILFNRHAKTSAVHKDQFVVDLKMYIRPTKLKEGYRFNITLNDAPPTPEAVLKRTDSFQSLLYIIKDKDMHTQTHGHNEKIINRNESKLNKRSLSFEALLDVTSPRRNRSRGSGTATLSTFGSATQSLCESPRSIGGDLVFNDDDNERYDNENENDNDDEFLDFEHEHV